MIRKSKAKQPVSSKEDQKEIHHQVFLLVVNRRHHPGFAGYLDSMGELAVHYYNEILFTIRQQFTYYHKEDPKEWYQNEIEVWNNVQAQVKETGKPFGFLNQYFMQTYAIRYIHREEFKPLDSHTKLLLQQQGIQDFKNWLSALEDWKAHPEKYKAKPKMPGYKKTQRTSFSYSNQHGTIENNQLYLTKKHSIPLTWLPEDFGRLKQVDVTPYYDTWRISLVYETKEREPAPEKPENIAGMDLGVDRLAAIAEKSGCLICNGKPIKSELQYYNKKLAYYQSLYDPWRDQWNKKNSMAPLPKLTRRMMRLYKKRNNLIHDSFHKISTAIIQWLSARDVTVLVIGKNDGWKQELNMGDKNNQNFAFIPHSKLIEMLQYKAEKAGIEVILTEESYTSACSYLDKDILPVWDGCHHKEYKFSGKRSPNRSQYVSKDGIIIQSDIHGGANIARKVHPEVEYSVQALQTIEKLTIPTRIPKAVKKKVSAPEKAEGAD